MKKITLHTTFKKMLADVYTPVGIYLRLRDKYRDTILLESTDFHAGENSYSFIGINAIAGIEISSASTLEYKLPAQPPEHITIEDRATVLQMLRDFMQRFEITEPAPSPIDMAQGLFGYMAYDAVQFFDTISFQGDAKKEFNKAGSKDQPIPMIRYRLYQYVIAIDHFKDELYICENHIKGLDSGLTALENLIRGRDLPIFPFSYEGEEQSNLTDNAYREMVKKGVASCFRGDVFQIVLSRRFQQKFTGDEFNVYRALRSINPSPYLFYFDYGDYKLIGSSPESQLIVKNNTAIVHPIAGTVKRTGDHETDKLLALQLENDAKENAEHVMLVDLARNDLSRLCDEVTVSHFKKINYYSHVIHLVSEVTGRVIPDTNPFTLLGVSFPAGTLSGAPKYRAMQLINEYEPTARGYYGGAIGFVGFNGTVNHAIMIRTFLSRNNTLTYQAGAGIVSASQPDKELEEVNHKLNALKQAIMLAKKLGYEDISA